MASGAGGAQRGLAGEAPLTTNESPASRGRWVRLGGLLILMSNCPHFDDTSTSTTTTSLAIRTHACQSRPALVQSRRGAGWRAGRKTASPRCDSQVLGHANITQTSKCPATTTPCEHNFRRFEERIDHLTPIDTRGLTPPQNAHLDNIATREAIQQNTTKHKAATTLTSLLTGGLLVRIQPEEPTFPRKFTLDISNCRPE